MVKQKFELTSDLINVVSEPNTYELNKNERINDKNIISYPKEQINLKISKVLKNEFHVWCIKNDINMTEGLELALSKLIRNPENLS